MDKIYTGWLRDNYEALAARAGHPAQTADDWDYADHQLSTDNPGPSLREYTPVADSGSRIVAFLKQRTQSKNGALNELIPSTT